MAAWFRHVLRAKVSIDITPRQGLEYANIAAIELGGEGFDASITITDRNTAETRINGNVEEVTALPMPTTSTLFVRSCLSASRSAL